MERTKYFIIIITLLIFECGVAAEKNKIYAAYINGDMQQWKLVMNQMQEQTHKSSDFLVELVNYQYGYIGWCLGNNKEKEAKVNLELAEENLEKLENLKADASTINAYKSAFYGFRIGLSTLKAPFIGPKSVHHAELAIRQDKTNPMGYIQYGNSQFYMPSVFGGSKKEAVEYYIKALKLMEKDSAYLVQNWNYLSLLTQIAQAYQKMENFDEAEYYYQKTLKAEPRFSYVKNELYPEFLKEKNKNE